MNALDKIETSAPAIVVMAVILVIFLVIATGIGIHFAATKDDLNKIRQSKFDVPPEEQTGKSVTFYRVVAVGVVVLIALGGVFGWKVITGLVGDSSGTSTVQTTEVEER